MEDGAIRVGLGRVAELTERGRGSVLGNQPFDGLADLIARTELRIGEVESLVRAGALDFTGRSRPEMLLELNLLHVELERKQNMQILLCLAIALELILLHYNQIHSTFMLQMVYALLLTELKPLVKY